METQSLSEPDDSAAEESALRARVAECVRQVAEYPHWDAHTRLVEALADLANLMHGQGHVHQARSLLGHAGTQQWLALIANPDSDDFRRRLASYYHRLALVMLDVEMFVGAAQCCRLALDYQEHLLERNPASEEDRRQQTVIETYHRRLAAARDAALADPARRDDSYRW